MTIVYGCSVRVCVFDNYIRIGRFEAKNMVLRGFGELPEALGAAWGPSGVPRGPPRQSLGHLGRSLGRFGAALGCLGASSGGPRERSGASQVTLWDLREGLRWA